MTKRAYRYRFYPTESQKLQLARTFGSVRFVYNWALNRKSLAYQNEKKNLRYNDISRELTLLKRHPDNKWLQGTSSVALQQALRHLDRAFQNFFNKTADYPSFHKKHGKQSASFMASAFTWDGEHLTLAKMSEPLNIRWSRRFTGTPSSVTVSKDTVDRYHVSILVDEEIPQAPKSPGHVGIDLGLTDAVILSTGEKVGNRHFLRKYEKRLARA